MSDINNRPYLIKNTIVPAHIHITNYSFNHERSAHQASENVRDARDFGSTLHVVETVICNKALSWSSGCLQVNTGQEYGKFELSFAIIFSAGISDSTTWLYYLEVFNSTWSIFLFTKHNIIPNQSTEVEKAPELPPLRLVSNEPWLFKECMSHMLLNIYFLANIFAAFEQVSSLLSLFFLECKLTLVHKQGFEFLNLYPLTNVLSWNKISIHRTHSEELYNLSLYKSCIWLPWMATCP